MARSVSRGLVLYDVHFSGRITGDIAVLLVGEVSSLQGLTIDLPWCCACLGRNGSAGGCGYTDSCLVT